MCSFRGSFLQPPRVGAFEDQGASMTPYPQVRGCKKPVIDGGGGSG